MDLVRDLMRGAAAWPSSPTPWSRCSAVRCRPPPRPSTCEAWSSPPRLQALARLHTAAAAGLLPPSQVGRPRRAGESPRELADLGPAPDGDDVPTALWRHRRGWCSPRPQAPAVVVAALVHAEIATVRPFVRGNGVVARAMERAVIQASGLDPTGVAVPRSGTRQGGRGLPGRARGIRAGTPQGVALWLGHCAGGHRGRRAGGDPHRRRGPRRPAQLSPGRAGPTRDVAGPPEMSESQGFPLAPDAGYTWRQVDGREPDDHRESHRGPTRGQSTGGPIVTGLSRCDNYRIHAW